MLLCKYRCFKVVKNLVNMTDQEFSLYEEGTGNIVRFPPCKGIESVTDSLDGSLYVVDAETFETIKERPDIDLGDYAVVKDKNLGRGGVEITVLFWGENPSKRVCYVG